MKEWLGEQHETQRALREIRYPLLDHRDRHLAQASIAIAAGKYILIFGRKPVHEERACMDRCLGNEPVGCGDTQQAREERCQAKERKIIVEASRLAERELGSLRDQRLRETKRSPIYKLQM